VADESEFTIVIGDDWQIIPLENLIARVGDDTELITGVQTAEDARTAYETLELGADGVLLDSDDPDEIRRTVEVRDEMGRETLDMQWAEVTDVEQTGSADRVCIDTGNPRGTRRGDARRFDGPGLFFVHAETAESPYVASRPFRVNAGAVHAYVRTPDGGTKYLSELQSGDEVQVVDANGNTREAIVGRAKIEKRPMFRVQAETDEGTVSRRSSRTPRPSRSGPATGARPSPTSNPATRSSSTSGRRPALFGEAVEESIIEK